MPEPVVIRPRGGQILAWAAIGACAVGLFLMVITDGPESLVLWSWPLLLVAWLAWLLYIHPYVSVTDGFVEIGNPFRTHRVPWGDIRDVESRYAFSVVTAAGRSIRSWAAPAPGVRQALSTRREEVARSAGDGDTRRPSDAEGTASGDVSDLVRRRVEAYRRDSGPKTAGGTATTFNVAQIGVTAALLAATVLSLTVPHG
jgi:hypothetical protein